MVGLGALGIVVEVTLQCVPTFLLRADEGSATLAEVLEQWPSWTAENDHVDLHWFPHTEWVLTKRNNRVDGPPAPLSGWRRLVDDELLANGALALVNEIGTRRPAWQARLNEVAGQTLSPRTFTDHSAAVLVSPRRVRFVECEYAVPRTSLVPVITELRRWIDAGDERIGIPIEIRSAAADDLWLSTGYQRENAYVAVHHYWRQDPTPLLRRLRGHRRRARRPPALGQAAHPRRRAADGALPPVRRLRGAPGPPRPWPGVHQPVPGPGRSAPDRTAQRRGSGQGGPLGSTLEADVRSARPEPVFR